MADSLKKKKTTPVRQTVNKVKTAPKKIVEHALNTAIDTVEKAVQTDINRSTKRAIKTAQKLEKAEKAAKIAQQDAKRASNMSTRFNKTKKISSDSLGIKDKIKTLISHEKEAAFYYDPKKLLVLTFVYALIAILVYGLSKCLLYFDMFNSWILFILLVLTQILCLAALAGSLFVVISPQTLAVTNKYGIKIDHNELLKWTDIEVAEEKYTSCLSRRPLIALHVKPSKLPLYKLTFMQKLCKANVFTPFSIPLYAMKPEDAKKIREIVQNHVKYQDSK